MVAARNSWMQQMREMQSRCGSQRGSEAEPGCSSCRASSEGNCVADSDEEAVVVAGVAKSGTSTSSSADLHWLLKIANPEWSSRELQGAKEKLSKVDISTYMEFEEALREKGALNQRLRDKGLKVFGNATLMRLRSQVDIERERKRCERLLAERRQRERVEEERRHLTESAHASTVAEAVDTSEDDSEGGDLSASAIEASVEAPEKTSVVHSADVSASEVEGPAVNHPAPIVLGTGSRCWEWPLTREEKKERITMLDRQVLCSYKRELEELQARKMNEAQHEKVSFCEDELESASDSEWNSVLDCHIAG